MIASMTAVVIFTSLIFPLSLSWEAAASMFRLSPHITL
jgi:hypothetical protein